VDFLFFGEGLQIVVIEFQPLLRKPRRRDHGPHQGAPMLHSSLMGILGVSDGSMYNYILVLTRQRSEDRSRSFPVQRLGARHEIDQFCGDPAAPGTPHRAAGRASSTRCHGPPPWR
jgi:hypothetical protein